MIRIQNVICILSCFHLVTATNNSEPESRLNCAGYHSISLSEFLSSSSLDVFAETSIDVDHTNYANYAKYTMTIDPLGLPIGYQFKRHRIKDILIVDENNRPKFQVQPAQSLLNKLNKFAEENDLPGTISTPLLWILFEIHNKTFEPDQINGQDRNWFAILDGEVVLYIIPDSSETKISICQYKLSKLSEPTKIFVDPNKYFSLAPKEWEIVLGLWPQIR